MAWSHPDAPAVMVVDDTDAVRIVLRMLLTVLGYRVLEATAVNLTAPVVKRLY